MREGRGAHHHHENEMKSLSIKNLRVSIGEKEIIRGLTLEIPKGEVHAVMGPNGSGKSTLSKAIGGHPDYTVTGGEVLLDGENILGLGPDERSRKGLFLAFQYPMEIPGVSNANFLRAALNARQPEGVSISRHEVSLRGQCPKCASKDASKRAKTARPI